jgi:hypothetical protein
MIRELLLNNQHRVTVTLQPDAEMSRRKIEAEKDKLARIKASLSADEQQHLVEQAAALSQRQAKEDDPGLLPKVGLDDVPEKIFEPERHDGKVPGTALRSSFYGQGTNGLSYQQVIYPLPALDDELLEVLPLYSSCVPEFGVGDKSYDEVQTWQASVSGGLNCFSSLRGNIDDVQATRGVLSFSSKALDRNLDAMAELLQRTVHELRFDESQRLKEIVEQICARKEASITGQGHSLAMNLASSRMSPTAQLTHRFAGLQGIKTLKALRDEMNQDQARQALLERFQILHEKIVSRDPQFLLIGEPGSEQRMLDSLADQWASDRNSTDDSEFALPSIREQLRQAWTTSTQVNFCAKAYPTVPSGHEDNATLHVLAAFMRNGFLHQAIRERGGAYGGGAGQDANSASFRFFSYRDPRLEGTLDDFDRAVDWVINQQHPDNQLEEAILGVIGTMDKSTSPAGEAKQAYYNHLFGRSLEHRMRFRQQVLGTSLADLRAVAERYFAPEKASIGIISSKDALENLQIDGLELVNL